MATSTSESTPLLQHQSSNNADASTSHPPPPRVSRTVTFNPLTSISSQTGASSAGGSLRPAHQPSNALSPSSSSNAVSTVGGTQPMLSALNSKLRRRNSHGSPLPTTQPPSSLGPRLGAQRSTKTTEKLKILPNPELGDEEADEESGRDVYSQFTRIKDPNARRDAARLGKADRDRLPRVTAYCTAQGYRLEGIMKFMKSRTRTRGANPKLFDECLYSPYNYEHLKKNKNDAGTGSRSNSPVAERRAGSRSPKLERLPPRSTVSPRVNPVGRPSSRPGGPTTERRFSDSAVEVDEQQKNRREDLLELQQELGPPTLDPESAISIDHPTGGVALTQVGSRSADDLHKQQAGMEYMQSLAQAEPEPNTTVHTPEVFVFEYGTIVIWGMSPQQEQRFIADMVKFSESPLPAESIQTEDFNFYYTRDYQARIYNDFISLRDPKNHMTKLAIAHALSQSVKTSLFEDLVSETIETTSPLPALIAQTGSVNLTRRQLNMQIGELFILRINVHLQGSVLDSPELMWAEPHLEPIYSAVRSYLEIGQRVGLLTERLDVIADLLAVLREQGSRRHGEVLEWIVIVLIAAEIVVAAINILVDVWAGVD